MRQYPQRLLKLIQKEEGNVASIRAEANALKRRKKDSAANSIMGRIHPDNAEDGLTWGAYYDSRGYLTAGSGTLISMKERGSSDEKADIDTFKKTYKVDPFRMNQQQAASLISTKLEENVNAYLASPRAKDLDFDSLPESAQVAVGSLAYNLGGNKLGKIGVNYTESLKKAATTKSADDWMAFRKQQEGFHGDREIEAGLIKRRKLEASQLDDLTTTNESSISPTGILPILSVPNEPIVPKQNSVIDTIMSNVLPQDAEAAEGSIIPPQSPEPDFVLQDQMGTPKVEFNPAGTILENTRFSQQQTEMQAAKTQEDIPLMQSFSKFGDNVVNSFMTENIVGSTVKQAVIKWDENTEIDPDFNPTKMEGYEELVKDVPTENLGAILEGSYNQQQFINRVIGFKIEQDARAEMSQYMSTNPIAGFVGIGLASALDVTSFIPVTKAVRLSGLTKSMKGIPMLTKAIGAQVAENVVQDLIQETILTENSEIRKWDDGDILYGMVGGIVLGGAGGAFKAQKTVGKFQRLAQKMNSEKNLDGINMMIRSAETKGLPSKTVSELKQVRQVIEQSLQKEHQLRVLEEVSVRQESVAKGLKENKRMDIIKKHADFNEGIEKQIAAERARVRAEVDSMKKDVKVAKQGRLESVEVLRKDNKSIQKQLDKLKASKVQNADISNEITKLSKKLKLNENKIKDNLKKSQTDAKKIRAERARLIRKLDKQGDSYTNPKIVELEQQRIAREAEYKLEVENFDKDIDAGNHPELEAFTNVDQLNNIAGELGLPKAFTNLDELDETLGLRFDDTLSSARVRFEPSEYMKAQDVNEMFNKTDPELWNVVSRQFQESRDNPAIGLATHNVAKNSVAAKVIRATRLNKFLTTDSVIGRFTLNKSSLKASDNEFAAAFYNWAAPDGMGRLGGGKLSVIEQQQLLQSVYGGQLREQLQTYTEKLNDHLMNNRQLRNDMGLPTNNLAARIMMTEAYFPEKLSNLLRDELIEVGNAKTKYGDEVGEILNGWRTDFNKLSAQVLADAKEAGVTGVDMLEETENWFHRAWDNKAAIAFDIKHGTEKMEELIRRGMLDHMIQEGKEVTEAMMPLIDEQAKRFAFGLRSKDTRIFQAADTDYQAFMRKLMASNVEGIDPQALKAEVKRIEVNVENRRAKELARRKPISLTSSIEIDGGVKLQIRDLLESNVLASQTSYMGSMAGRIAAARNGIKDVDLLDEWADRAVELERKRGKLDTADYIERSMREDVDAVKYGHSHREAHVDASIGRLQRIAMKYNAARLMQYTGISSIAEMNGLVAEAGWKAVGQVVADNGKALLKSYMFGGVTGKVFRDSMYDELSVISGVGLEDISFDALVSSSRMINSSTAGRAAERVIDNAAKLTRRATAHVETTGRRLALNALAINYGNIANGKDVVGNILGGVSNVNLVEAGLADLVNGKAVKNKMWDNLMESIRKNALDEDGNNAFKSGKGIRQFNLREWDLDTRRKFGEVLAQQANHIIVNPDSTTAKLWHNTWWGAMFNQFRTFSNNATSKVAGHNLTQAMQGYRMGEVAEFSKLAQKYFWGAALGKLSLVTYGAINNAGREDFNDRMEQYMGVDEFRDWTRALGRSSAIAGADNVVDTFIGLGNLSGHMQVDPLFDSSTIGQSRDRLSWQTTATGQLAVGTAAIGTGVLKGDFKGAGKQALKMSPFRRQLGVNQLLNAMGID